MKDEALFERMKRGLFVALVGDVMDGLGRQHQFLSPALKPVDPTMIILGRAMPVVEQDIRSHEDVSKPFGVMFEALDDLKPGEVYICSGASHRYALWGGLMSTRALHCRAAGAVVHGFHRDTSEILRLNFPVASFGSYSQDQRPRGRVVGWRTPIELDGVTINPGDIVYGDRDGVLVIPQDIESETIERAFEKSRGEKVVLKALQGGMSTVEAFAKFGIM